MTTDKPITLERIQNVRLKLRKIQKKIFEQGVVSDKEMEILLKYTDYPKPRGYKK